jgi:hypothetical protein
VLNVPDGPENTTLYTSGMYSPIAYDVTMLKSTTKIHSHLLEFGPPNPIAVIEVDALIGHLDFVYSEPF